MVSVWGRLYFSTSTSGNMSSFQFTLPFTCQNGQENEMSNCFQVIRSTSWNQQEGFRIFRVRSNGAVCEMNDNNGGSHGHFGTTNPHINVFLNYRTS